MGHQLHKVVKQSFKILELCKKCRNDCFHSWHNLWRCGIHLVTSNVVFFPCCFQFRLTLLNKSAIEIYYIYSMGKILKHERKCLENICVVVAWKWTVVWNLDRIKVIGRFFLSKIMEFGAGFALIGLIIFSTLMVAESSRCAGKWSVIDIYYDMSGSTSESF